MEKKTPLYECHLEAKGKIVEFGGYLLPIQYESGIMAEHKAIRENVGMFDVSHMGEFIMEGKDALANVNYLFTNDFTDLALGGVRYSIMCQPDGNTVDDLLVYRMKEDKFYIVVNASNRDKDREWIESNKFGDVNFEDISDSIGQIAIQGPNSEKVVEKLTNQIPQKYYTFLDDVVFAGKKVLISRTGYTGEDGFEVYCRSEDTPHLWNEVLKAGAEFGLIPCGLGCRDTLRFEAGMPLYGHELSETISPVEAGLKMFVKLDKENFIGKEALSKDRLRKRMAFRVVDKGIAREHCDVYVHDELVGQTTTGTFSPTLNQAIFTALIDVDVSSDNHFSVDVRGRKLKAEVTKFPFVRKSK
ncbi:MAG: glycine cleavage system aminomethyltransferase GcvT [Erysipelotrichaceae bacterium]|nr:glycine cleavage system aminomethyltransferase GcvT [Erysipelotrichaceae bacterium]